MNLTLPTTAIAPMSADAIARVAAFERTRLELPQIPIRTHHVLHAGMYARTVMIPAGVVLTGALIKIPTVLVIAGDCIVSRGDDEGLRITGTAVLPASAGRKQVFATYADTTVTMSFPTSAASVEEAEAEFTDEAGMLFSRHDPDLNTIVITGE